MLPEEVGFQRDADKQDRVNERGNTIHDRFHPDIDRYLFDFKICTRELGWLQFDTDQDAWYFGIWVNPEKRQVVNYAEGDISIINCPTELSYHAELRAMAEFHGEPPPMAIGIDCETGVVTKFYDERPT